jgi:hypothetical protein
MISSGVSAVLLDRIGYDGLWYISAASVCFCE